MTHDPYDLQRFVEAQSESFDGALEELRAGAKRTHWMWFVFPQVAGLGHSPMARHFAIGSIEEARAYLEHRVLGPRLLRSVEALMHWAGERSAKAIFGPVDSMKLRSSLTLFEAASGDPLFGRALDAFFGGERDERTLTLPK